MACDPRLHRFRGVAAVLAASLLLQAVSAAALFVLKVGPGARQVSEFYLGSEARFTVAKSAAGLFEVALPHLVAIPLALFVVAHLVGYAGVLRRRAFAALAGVSFASALAGVACSFAVRFASPRLAWAKVAAFGAFEATLLAWTLLVVYVFFWPARVTVSARERRGAVSATMGNEARGCPR
jgi:hypothetical protein